MPSKNILLRFEIVIYFCLSTAVLVGIYIFKQLIKFYSVNENVYDANVLIVKKILDSHKHILLDTKQLHLKK